MQDIATTIKRLRRSAGLSIAQVAEKSNLSPGYISKLENGENKSPSLQTVHALAQGLGLPMGHLLAKLGFLNFDGEQQSPSMELVTQALRSNGYSVPQAAEIIRYARYLRGKK